MMLQGYCASGKGLAYDAISDTWIKKTTKLDLLRDLWNDHTLSALDHTFKARLIPLNKVWPDIPRED